MTIRTVGCIWTGYTIGAALGALAGLSFGKRVLLCPAVCLCLTADWSSLWPSRNENPGVATTAGGYIAVRYMEPQIHLRSQFRFVGMRPTLSFLAMGALILFPAVGQAGDIGDKAEDVIRGIGRGFSDVAHDVKQAVAGHDVDVSLGETHMEMPTSVDAGAVTFKVTNVGAEERGFKVSGSGLESSFTAPLPPGATENLTVNLKPGVYQVESPAQGDPTKTLAVQVTAVSSE